MGEKTADNQTPLLQTQPADFPLKRTGLFSLLPVHPCLFPSFTLNSIVMIKKSFVWLWIKIQGLQTSLFFRLIKFPWIKNSLSFFFFFNFHFLMCQSSFYVPWNNERIREWDGKYWSSLLKKKKNLEGDFLILNIWIVKGTYGQQ